MQNESIRFNRSDLAKPAAGSGGYGISATAWHLKRGVDIFVAANTLVFFAPMMALIALALLIQDGWPILYKQRRIGSGGRPFFCWKYRSMSKGADQRLQTLLEGSEALRQQWHSKQKLDDDPRVHFVGALLRRSSLDELPQLVNVLRGEMSIVGPRPITEEELRRYGNKSRYYCAQRPGLTGLWQVSGRSNTSYDERIELDVRYSKTWSLTGDLIIMWKTIGVVLFARGSR